MPKLHLEVLIGVLLLLAASSNSGVRATSTPDAAPSTPIDENATCPSRSINYVTQTLPQQCLRTGWTSKNISSEVDTESTVVLGSLGSDTRSEKAATTNIGHSAPSLTDLPRATTDEGEITTSSLSSSNTATSLPFSAAPVATEQRVEASPEVLQDNEADTLLDNANFLSFEEWKSKMLEKAGQSPETLGNNRAGGGASDPRVRSLGISNALDSLGEDAEIELDFSGFVNPENAPEPIPAHKVLVAAKKAESVRDESGGEPERVLTGVSKDAGTTCKERSNYASFDCAATILKTNSESKGSTSVLVENKDSYMLNECNANNKFFIVELCDDILVDTIVLANYEFFSSTFRTFRASVSDRFPVKIDKWRELGTFEARNSREMQAFAIQDPVIWTRYVRIEFLTQYGNEYYCPVSLLRVHGKTMMDDYRNDMKTARGEDEPEDDIPVIIAEAEHSLTDPNNFSGETAEAPRNNREEPSQAVVYTSTITLEPVKHTEDAKDPEATRVLTPTIGGPANSNEPLQQHGSATNSPSSLSQVGSEMPSAHAKLQASIDIPQNDAGTAVSNISKSNVESTSSVDTVSLANTLKPIENMTSTSQPAMATSNVNTSLVASSKAQMNSTSQATSKTPSQPPLPNPTTQESFFKSIHKRLQFLESNSTLSLQYIEEQSRILRDAFTKVEKRQLSKTTTFLETLNTTVLSELREFRQQYDQIWQSTVLELSSQREQSQREVIALSARLSILADEMLFQKRMAILQFILIILCLGLVIFSRIGLSPNSSSTNYLELPPVVSNMVNKSSTSLNLSRYANFDPSPNGSPTSTRPASRYGLFSRGLSSHGRSPSDESAITSGHAMNHHDPDPTSHNNNIDHSDSKNLLHPDLAYSPPTPVSDASGNDHEDDFVEPFNAQSPPLSSDGDGSPAASPRGVVRFAQSGPSTPNGATERERSGGLGNGNENGPESPVDPQLGRRVRGLLAGERGIGQ
ncbi:hypothetical protein MMC09_004670 [Bachmanniomyces sp. S44760]|nr:hypothetical protein [Bachmanniomyces sp. S44760]